MPAEHILDFVRDNFSTTVGVLLMCSLTIIILLLFERCRYHISIATNPCNSNGVPFPPCLPSLPFVGSMPFLFSMKEMCDKNSMLISTLAKSCMNKSKHVGSVFAFYMSSRYTVILNGKKTIHNAFVKKAVNFADRRTLFIERHYTNPNMNGISFAPYSESFARRRNAVFSILRDLGYGKRVVERRLNHQLNQFIKHVNEQHGQPFNPKTGLYHCVVGVVLSFICGRQFDHSDPLLKLIKDFISASNENAARLETYPASRYLPSVRKSLKTMLEHWTVLSQLMDVEIDGCMSSGREDSLVHKYIQWSGPESAHADELRYIIRDLYLGASDTTLHVICWLLLMLANNPHVQETLQRQVDNQIGSESRLPSLDDISALPYVEATILEMMRTETLLPLGAPHMTLCDTEINGYFLPKGTVVLPNLLSAHMDSDEWDNPTEFRPERFIASDGKLVRKDRVIPFSLGKRSCPGEQLARQQLFIIFTTIVRHFDVRPPEGQSRVDVGRMTSFVNEPTDFYVRMIPRDVIAWSRQ